MSYISALVDRVKPTKIADGTFTAARAGRYGEVMMHPVGNGTTAIADEGSYFKCINPTPGTGIAANIVGSFSATSGIMLVYNNDSAGGKRIYLDYLTMICTAAPVSSTAFHILVAVDNTNRYSAGGTLAVPVNPNMDDSTATISTVHAINVTYTAESGSVRRMSRGILKAAIPAVGDSYMLQFGSVDSQGGALTGTGIMATDQCGPVIIGPGHSALIHAWWPANVTTAGSWEYELGYWER